MKKRILTGIIALAIACGLLAIICGSRCAIANHTNDKYTKEELTLMINEEKAIKENSHIMANSARALGWTNDDKLIKELQSMWYEADENQKKYQNCLEEILINEAKALQKIKEQEKAKWAAKSAEYPVATQIWRYMKDQGWNDYVCAGIMGNIMAEVGGQTLNIRYTLSSNGYYGMCQWSRGYSEVWGAGLETQCNFLRDTIKYEFDTYGSKYQKGFNFNSFLNMTDAQQAALAFAKSYERCASKSYKVRQKNALKAYNYFVS